MKKTKTKDTLRRESLDQNSFFIAEKIQIYYKKKVITPVVLKFATYIHFST